MIAGALSIAAPYLAAAGLPLLLLLLSALFRRFYLGTIARGTRSDDPGSAGGEAALLPPGIVVPIRWHDIKSAAERLQAPQLAIALSETRAVRAVFVLSAAAFAVLSAAVVWYGQRKHGASAMGALAIASVNTASAVTFVVAYFRIRLIPALAIAAGWVVLQFVVLMGIAGAPFANAAGALSGGITYGILVPAPALVLFAQPALRPLIAGFVPAAGLWIVVSAIVGIVLAALGLTVEGTPSLGAVAMGGAAMVIGIAVAIWRIRRGMTRRFLFWWTFGIVLAAIAAKVSRLIVLGAVLGIGVNGSLVLLGWGCFAYFLRLKASGRMPDDVVHFSGGLFVLSVWTYLIAGLQWYETHWAVLPFAIYLPTLYGLLYRRHAKARARVPRRLLLLRPFHRTPMDSWRLDALRDSWCRFGTVEMAVGVDLALRTVNAMAIENFLLGRIDRVFLKTELEAHERLSQLRNVMALDGCFPLHELHCLSETWQYVITRLVADADLVLMDLRGMQRQNASLIREIELVLHRIPLSRIVLLADGQTDERVLAEAAGNAWRSMPIDSPNRLVSQPGLDVIRCSSSRAENARAIVTSVFAAAFSR